MAKGILVVLAHPDDETFFTGGALALYARKDCEIYYLCATRGEANNVKKNQLKGYKDVAELRTDELMRAAKVLGIKDVFFLGYRDSGLPGAEENKHPDAQINHPVEEVAARVVKHIRELRPDVVLTFDPLGGYHHPDHIHIHKAATLAFEKANDVSFHPEAGVTFKPQALYCHILPRRILRWITNLMPLAGRDPAQWGRYGTINLKAVASTDFPIHVRLDIRSVANIKRHAGAQYISQGGMRRGLMGLINRLEKNREEYMRAYPPVGEKFLIQADLFDI